MINPPELREVFARRGTEDCGALLSVQVQDIGNTSGAVAKSQDEPMPWRKTEPMSQRSEFVLSAMETRNFRALCAEFGISAKTGYKWKERFIAVGLEGLAEESRRPQRNPNELAEAVVCELLRLKVRHPNWGPKKIRDLYLRQYGKGPSESSVKRVLERAGMVKKKRVRQASQGGRIWSGRKGTRANEVWTMDFKGWWYDLGRAL